MSELEWIALGFALFGFIAVFFLTITIHGAREEVQREVRDSEQGVGGSVQRMQHEVQESLRRIRDSLDEVRVSLREVKESVDVIRARRQ